MRGLVRAVSPFAMRLRRMGYPERMLPRRSAYIVAQMVRAFGRQGLRRKSQRVLGVVCAARFGSAGLRIARNKNYWIGRIQFPR